MNSWLAIVNPHAGSAKGRKTKAAVNSGVRLNRTASVQNNVRMQGDLTHMTPEAVAVRRALQGDPKINELVRDWWDSIQLKDCIRFLNFGNFC